MTKRLLNRLDATLVHFSKVFQTLTLRAHCTNCTHKRTLLVYGDKLGPEQRGWEGKLLYTRAIGAGLVLPRGSAVELILKWSSQWDSHSQAAGGHRERPGASFSICFLSSLDWPPLTMGAGQPVRGAGVCQRWPGPKERGAMMPSIPRLASHFRIISHPRCKLGRQCIMGGASFAFNPDELFTRAKNHSSAPCEGWALHRKIQQNVLGETCRRHQPK